MSWRDRLADGNGADGDARGVDFDAPDYGFKEEDKPSVKVLHMFTSFLFLLYFLFF